MVNYVRGLRPRQHAARVQKMYCPGRWVRNPSFWRIGWKVQPASVLTDRPPPVLVTLCMHIPSPPSPSCPLSLPLPAPCAMDSDAQLPWVLTREINRHTASSTPCKLARRRRRRIIGSAWQAAASHITRDSARRRPPPCSHTLSRQSTFGVDTAYWPKERWLSGGHLIWILGHWAPAAHTATTIA